MRKKLLLGLFLIMAISATNYAQQSVDPSTSTDITVANGTTVNFNISLGGLSIGTINIQAKELPGGAITTWSATAVNLTVGGVILNFGTSGNSFTPNSDSVYEISYSFDPIVGPTISRTFTITSGNGTLGIGNIAAKPELFVFSKDGIVTVKNTNNNAVTGMAIYSMSGSQVYASNKAVASINLSTVANGVYVLTIQQGASVTSKKFIKS